MTEKAVITQNETHSFTKYVENPQTVSLKYSSDKYQHHHRHSEKPIDPVLFSKSLEILNNKFHDNKKAKKLLRNADISCDNQIRTQLWLQLARLLGGEVHRADAYDETLKAVYGDEVETFRTADKTLLKSYPQFIEPRFSNHHHHLNPEGVFTTHRILMVIAFERPDITYAPTLPSITSILLHYLSEEQVYHLISALLSRTAKERFLTQTRISYHANSAVFKKLANKYFKTAITHLRKGGHNIENLFNHWIFWIFNHLPFDHLVRVVDCYLYEGPKILYRAGLSILHHFDKKKDEKSIEEYCERIDVCPKTLLKTSFNVRGLSRGQMFELMSKRELSLSTRDSTFDPHLASTTTGSLQVDTNTDSQLLTRNEWRHIYEWLPKRVTLRRPFLIFSTAEHGTSLLTFYKQVEGHNPTLMVIKSTSGHMIGAYLAGDWAERRGSSRSKYFGTGESFVCQMSPSTPVKYAWVGIAGGDNAEVGLQMDGELNNRLSGVVGESEGGGGNEGGGNEGGGNEGVGGGNGGNGGNNGNLSFTIPPNIPPPTTSTPIHRMIASMFATGDSNGITIGGGNGQAIRLDSNLLEGSTTPCSTFNNPPLIHTKEFRVATLEVFTFQ